MTGIPLHAYGKVRVGVSMSSNPACIEGNGVNYSTLDGSDGINLYSILFSIRNEKIALYYIPELDSIGGFY
jgi:hypothetical protein